MSFLQALRTRWRPDHPAIVTSDLTVTYQQLDQRIERAAGWLLHAGLAPGDTIALQLPKCLGFLELHLAALGLGITTLPLNPAYTSAELRFYLQNSGAKVACLLDDRVEQMVELGIDLRPASTLRAKLDAAPRVTVTDALPMNTVAVLLYTSGTTGRPKGAVLQHGNLNAMVNALHGAWGWTPSDVLLHSLPMFHVHGLFVAQHGALMAGATTVWMPRFDAADTVTMLAEHHATIFMGVPTYYSRLLALPVRQTNLSSMRLFTSGSAPLPAAHHIAFEQRYGHRILERYGMTEVGIVLSNPLNGERRPGAVGLPLPGVRAKVTDPVDGTEVPVGEVGEIRISGQSVFDRYLGLPEATDAAIEDGWMHTGDLGFIDEDGYFHVIGRETDMIITGGLNVYPREVETRLLQHPTVLQAAVVGTPDADLGERVVATVVLIVGREGADLRAWCRETLAGYKCPRSFETRAKLPRNAMGKVQKAALRQTWQERTSSDPTGDPT